MRVSESCFLNYVSVFKDVLVRKNCELAKLGKNLLNKRLHPRTQVEFSENDGDVFDDNDDDDDNIGKF